VVVSVGAGIAAAIFMPKLKLFAVGVGIASLFLISIGFATERYARPIALGGLVLVAASILGGAAYLISEIIRTRRDAKSLGKSMVKAEKIVETFNVPPEAKSMMEEMQTAGAVKIFQEAKAEVKAEEIEKADAKKTDGETVNP
jgi:hypothetical protein